MGASDTTLTLTVAPQLNRSYYDCGFAQLGAVKIGAEVIRYKGVAGAVVNIIQRGDRDYRNIALNLRSHSPGQPVRLHEHRRLSTSVADR